MNRLNILHLSTPDVKRGAGIIPYDLHRLFSVDFNSQLVVSKTNIVEDGLISYFEIDKYSFLKQKIYRRIMRYLNKKTIVTNNDYCFDYNYGNPIVNVDKLLKSIVKPDVIIAYFMSGFFSFETLYELQVKTGAPVLLYFMDMAYLTGGCHYAWDCNGYKEMCDNCPAVESKTRKEFVKGYFRKNMGLISKMHIIPIAPSYQLHEQIKSSTLFKNKPVRNILLGMDQKIFRKKDKKHIRQKHNIHEDKFVVLFGSRDQLDKRKGWSYLLNIFEEMRKKDISPSETLLLGFGDVVNTENVPYEIVNFGFVNSLEQLADLYNIADVFVVPSIQDSGPSMVNQSVSCGTPVIMFDIGVSRDLVVQGSTGLRISLYDTESFAEAVLKIKSLNSAEYDKVSESCVQLARKKTSLEHQGELFKELINEIAHS